MSFSRTAQTTKESFSSFSFEFLTSSNFEVACQLFADINSYSVKMKFEKGNNDICYYNSEMHLLEPFGNIIKKAQSTGFKIKAGRSETKIETFVTRIKYSVMKLLPK